MTSMRRSLAVFLFSALSAIAAEPQNTNMRQLTDHLGKTVLYGNIAISPDGTQLAWVQSTAATIANQTCVQPVTAAAPAFVVKLGNAAGDREDFDPNWSPDSKTLALFSTAGEKEGQRQLWSIAADGSNARKLTQIKGYAARPRWSHDGKQIAFLYIENAGGGGPLQAAPITTGVVDTAIHNQRIAVLDLATGQLRQVSPPELHVYDYDWSPDDRRFVVTAAPGPGDNNWWIAQIYTVDIASGNATAIYKPALQIATPRWSPDGKSIAFIEGLMSDEGFHGGDLLTALADGKAVVNHTRGRKSSINSFFWSGSDRVVVAEYVGGGISISELALVSNIVREIWKGAEGLHAFGNFPNLAISKDAKSVAAVRSSFESPPEVWAGPIGQWKQITKNNAGLTPLWAKAESIEWRSDVFGIQGWIIPPATAQTAPKDAKAAPKSPAKKGKDRSGNQAKGAKQSQAGSDLKHPLVVLIHGGPSGVATPEWPAEFGMSRAIIAALSARGYYVLLPNPRGSYGQGEDFTKANVKNFGGGDLRDIMAGVDAAIAKFPIDPQRLGVAGWSYGGYMTMWTVTQTNRFGAAVAGAGIANWQSYYGQNLIDQWMIPFFGASVYDDPAVYERSSPIRFIKNVKTPTLVIVGERDAECPAPQSYEFWHALKALKIPTQLIVYPGEGHMFVQPNNQADRLEKTISWFDTHLK
jgi:dipeptidyl aminopeptidase/acylaminoacyl peptidase